MEVFSEGVRAGVVFNLVLAFSSSSWYHDRTYRERGTRKGWKF
jgi:hypothetical protein